MKMMYEMIYNALKEVGLETKYEPQDYLNFFCLGNREAPDREESLDAEDSTAVMTPQVFPLAARVQFSVFSLRNVKFPFTVDHSLTCFSLAEVYCMLVM